MEQAEKLCNRIFLIDKGRQVIYGTLDEIKECHGSKSVAIEFDGDGKIISDLRGVESANMYRRWVEIKLEEGTGPDAILKQLVGKISIKRFEVMAPSLHNIFVNLVGGNAKGKSNE